MMENITSWLISIIRIVFIPRRIILTHFKISQKYSFKPCGRGWLLPNIVLKAERHFHFRDYPWIMDKNQKEGKS